MRGPTPGGFTLNPNVEKMGFKSGCYDSSEAENNDEFNRIWFPKVLEYRAMLQSSTPEEYKIEANKLPGNLNGPFNAVKYLYDEQLLSEAEFHITDLSATDLVKRLQTGELTAVEALRAFGKRAVIGQQFTNLAVDIFIDEGLTRAQTLDEYYRKTGKTAGPLHGLPVSLEAQFNYKDKVTHAGYVGYIENYAIFENVTVSILKKLGAVFYIRTNVPQTMMHLDSNNNIVGRTRNPYNLALSSGGSSGGEGALVGFGGSPLGIGTDIGGSIRAPAAFSGCMGLRPTSRRISVLGCISAGAGQETVPGVCGPMAKTVEDIELFMKLYINQGEPWNYDAWCLRIPWREVAVPVPESISIAVMCDNEIVKPTPAIERGLKYVVGKLKTSTICSSVAYSNLFEIFRTSANKAKVVKWNF